MSYVVDKKLGLTYKIEEALEAGIELHGFEVKSVKAKLGKLEGSRVLIRGGEAFAVNVFIPPYQANNSPKSYDPTRTRKLLLTKKELFHLTTLLEKKNLTLHVESLYSKGRLIKCRVAVCSHKKEHDKRETIKNREANRELGRVIRESLHSDY